jgi:WD40 repeat protein
MIAFTPHAGKVTALGFSPDGTRLASVSSDGSLKVWDVSRLGSGAPVWEVQKAHESGINHCQFAWSGAVVYTGGTDGILKTWNAADGAPVAQTDPDAHPDAASYSVNAFGLSLCGRYVAYGGGFMWLPTEFVVARTEDLTPIRRVPGHACAVGIFVPQENGFITGGADHTVRLWDWHSTECHGIITLRGVIRGLASSRDGKHIAVSGGAIVHLYSARPPAAPGSKLDPRPNPQKAGEFRGHTKRVECIEFSPDGSRLASAAADGTVRLWEVPSARPEGVVGTGAPLRTFHPKLGPLHWVTFAPDGLTLAFSGQKGHVGLLDLDD